MLARYPREYLFKFKTMPEDKIKERLAYSLVIGNRKPRNSRELERIVKERHLSLYLRRLLYV